jgi:hypothetical protein
MRGVRVLASAFALAVSVVVASGLSTAASAQTAMQASGRVQCAAAGKVTYSKPHLLLVPKPGVVAKFKASLICSVGQTGHPGVTVVGGKLKGQSTAYTGSCQAPNPTSMSATIKWKATGGKVLPTTISWGAAAGGTSRYTHDFSGGTVTGSYAGVPHADANFVADTVGLGSCGVQGIKGWTFGTTGVSTLILDNRCAFATAQVAALGDGGLGSAVLFGIEPTSHPACAAGAHPTGTASATFTGSNPAYCASFNFQNDGITSLEAPPPYDGAGVFVTTDVTGWTSQHCVIASASYSGDAIYAGF